MAGEWDVVGDEPVQRAPKAAGSEWDVVDDVPARPAIPNAPLGEPERSLTDYLGDAGTRVRQGLNNVVGGLVGAPVNIANIPGTLARSYIDLAQRAGADIPQAALDMVAPIQQPAAVQGIRESLAINNAELGADLSPTAQRQAQEFQQTEGFLPSVEYLLDNPSYAGTEFAAQIPQFLQIVPGSLPGTIAAQGVGAAAQNTQQAEDVLRAYGLDEATIAERGADAFGPSLAINTALPYLIPGGASIERVLAGQAGKGIAREGAGRVGQLVASTLGETGTEAVQEGADQAIQNIATGRPVMEGVGQNAALGALIGGPGGLAAGTTEALAARAPAAAVRPAAEQAPSTAIDPAILAAGNAALGQPAPLGQAEPTDDLDALLAANLPPEAVQQAQAALGSPDQQALATLGDLMGEPADPDAAFRRPDPAPAEATPAPPATEPRASLPAQDFVSELAARMRVSAQEQAARTAAPAAQSPAAPVGSRPAGGDFAAPIATPAPAGDQAALVEAANAARARSRAASAAMDAFPKGAMGLTTDEAKATPEWKAARREMDQALAAERAANAAVVKARKAKPNASAPASNPAATTPAPKPRKPATARKPMDLLRVLAANGGLNREAFRAQGVDPAEFTRRAGFQYLFRKQGGMTPSDMREFMQQEGYLPADREDGTPSVDDNDAFDLFDRALRSGEEVFSMDQGDAVAADRFERHAQAEREWEAEFGAQHPDVAPEDYATAATVADIAERARAAGVDEFDIAPFVDEADTDYIARLEREIDQQEARRGTETGADQADRGERVRGQAAGAEQDFALANPEPRAEPRQEVAPQPGLFAPPTRGEQVRAVAEAKDASRNGLGRDLVRPEQGDGELLAGGKPAQADIEAGDDYDAVPTDDLRQTARLNGIKNSATMGRPRLLAELRGQDQARATRKQNGERAIAEWEESVADLKGKQPWEMTQAEWKRARSLVDSAISGAKGLDMSGLDEATRAFKDFFGYAQAPNGNARHEVAVLDALQDGKPVPENVRAEYRGNESDAFRYERKSAESMRDLLADATELTDAELTNTEREAFDRQRVDRGGLRAKASQENGERDADANGLRDAVTKAVGGAGVQVEYLRGMDGLPERTRRLLADRARERGAAQRTSGLYVPGKPPRVFLFTDVVATPETAAFTAAHEIAGHHGLRALLGDGLNHALDVALQNPTVAAVADSMAKRRKSSDRLLMAEEALADLAAAKRTGDWSQIEARHGVKVPLAMRSRLAAAIDNFIRRLKALFGKRGVAFTDAQVRELLENAWAAARGKGATTGEDAEQVVFHGTPHTVDKFSLQKIGTGEGAQAYGWGIYFASMRDVAREYQRGLSNRDGKLTRVGGKEIGVLHMELQRDGEFEKASLIESLIAHGDVARVREDAAEEGISQRAMDWFDNEVLPSYESAGNIYQVEVPEDSDLLDWDKPLSAQPEKVREAIRRVFAAPDIAAQWKVAPSQILKSLTDSGADGATIYQMIDNDPRRASEALLAAGIPGLRYLDGGSRNKGDGSHNYVIWDEGAIGEPQGLLESVEDAGASAEARRNEAAGTLPVARGAAGWAYDGSKWVGRKGRASAARAHLQDKMLAWRDVQGQIESQLQAAIPDAQNVYRLENLMHGRVSEGIDKIEREQVKPLMEAMRASGVKPDTLEEYLYARHAQERNAQIATINPAMPDGGSGMTNAEAAKILAGADKAKLEPLARKVDGIAAATRRRLLANGLITQEAFDAMEAQYEHYVPLRGKRVAEDADFGGTGMAGRGLDSRGKMVRDALGRGAGNRASDILAEIIGDAERSVILAEKARVGRAVMRIVLANPNPDLWMVEPVQTERALDANGEVYEKVVNDWSDPSVVAVRHKGQLYKVQINSVPLAQALNNIGIDHLAGITRVAGAVNRYFSAILTKYNPAFTPVNASRDALFGLTGLAAEHGELAALDAALHYPQAAAAAFQQARGKKLAGEWGDYADEFAANGGKTGYVNMPSTEDIARKIGSGKLTGYSPDGLRKAARAIGEAVGTLNDAVENALRLSAYVTLRKRGMSAEAAAAYAKDLTVNFNRKGFDGSAWNAWFLFYNASLQGAHRTSKLLRKPKTYAYLGMLAGAQVLATMAAMGMKDDNDEPLWNKVPDHVKRRNIVIVTGDGGLITIPMPYGFNLFPYVAGRITESVLNGQRGEKRAGDRAAQLVADTLSAATQSFSPVPLDTGVVGLIPNLLRIPVNVWANRNDFGNRIRDEQPYAKSDVPRASMGKPDTLEVFKLTAKGLNRVGGGDDLTPPPLSMFDVAPEDLEYLLGELTGGPGNLVTDIATSWQKATGGDYAQDLAPRDIPIAKRFRSNIDEQAAQQALYYDRREVIDRSLKRVRMAFKAEGPEAAEKLLAATPELKGAAFKRRKGNGRHGEAPGSIIVTDGSPQIIAIEGDPQMPPPNVYAAYKRAEKAIAARSDAVDGAFTMAPASILPTEQTRMRDATIRTENSIRQAAQSEFNAAWVRDVVGSAE